MKKNLLPALCASVVIGAATHAVGARADDQFDKPMFSFNGFGTLGAVHSSEGRAEFNASLFQPDGAGHTRSWSPSVDSRIGGQVTANVNDRLSAVLQIISEQQWDGSYTPIIEWANIKYAITPALTVRVGRIALPSFLFSDSRKVGYANPWVRPPVEIYQLLPASNNDGVDASYRWHAGGVTNTVKMLYAKSDVTGTDGLTVTARSALAVVDTIDYGSASFHVAYQQFKLTLPFIAAIPVPALARTGTNAPGKFMTIGVNYDPGDWFILGECAKSSIPFAGDQLGWYATGGYRIDRFTPYLGYARKRQLATSGIFPPTPQNTVSAGVRWDFMKNVDLKLQVDRINLDTGSSGVFANVQPDFQRGGKVNIVSVVVDFVF